MKNSEIIVVAGLGRCGSSLVMQMLAAAGIRCAGNYPSFEPDEMQENPSDAFIDSIEGGAVKLLDPHKIQLPKGKAYRFIFLTRSRRQQAMSTVKFMSIMGLIAPGRGLTIAGFDKMRDSLKADEAASLKAIQSHGCPIMRLRFEDLIDRSAPTIASIAEFLGMIGWAPPAKMLAAIRPRPEGARCYPGLLELQLMKEAEERDGIPDADRIPDENEPALATRGLESAPENHAGDGQPSGLPAAHGSGSSL